MPSKKHQPRRDGLAFISFRAVHIELVQSLDTDSFINAMERFIK